MKSLQFVIKYFETNCKVKQPKGARMGSPRSQHSSTEASDNIEGNMMYAS
jgi:hypothetical protein